MCPAAGVHASSFWGDDGDDAPALAPTKRARAGRAPAARRERTRRGLRAAAPPRAHPRAGRRVALVDDDALARAGAVLELAPARRIGVLLALPALGDRRGVELRETRRESSVSHAVGGRGRRARSTCPRGFGLEHRLERGHSYQKRDRSGQWRIRQFAARSKVTTRTLSRSCRVAEDPREADGPRGRNRRNTRKYTRGGPASPQQTIARAALRLPAE